jgi:hypothetical protein
MEDKALVIGGWFGGLATGVALRREGWAIEVFERAPELGEVGAGLSLWRNALAALDRLGLLTRWSGVAEALRASESRRIPRTRRVVRESRQAGTIAQWSNLLACRFREALLRSQYVARKQARQLEWMITPQVRGRLPWNSMAKQQRHGPGPLRPDQGVDVSGIRYQRGSRPVDHLLGRVRTELSDRIQARYRTAQRASVQRHRRAQGGSPMLRSIRPTRARRPSDASVDPTEARKLS